MVLHDFIDIFIHYSKCSIETHTWVFIFHYSFLTLRHATCIVPSLIVLFLLKYKHMQCKRPLRGNIHAHICDILLWPQKGSLMKTQTQILDNILYYTRKIELHRKGKKSRTVRITPILICLLAVKSLVLIMVRRVHYGKMGKAPTTYINPLNGAICDQPNEECLATSQICHQRIIMSHPPKPNFLFSLPRQTGKKVSLCSEH